MTRNEEIGERIQIRRKYLNRRYPGKYTQEAVAELLEERGLTMDPANLSHIEIGRNRIYADLLDHLAAVLEIDVGWFYGEKKEMDDFTEEVVQESTRMVAALDGKPDEVSQAAKDHVLRTFRTIRSTVGT